MADISDLKRELEQRVRIVARRTRFEWESQVKTSEPVDTGLMKSRTTFQDRQTSPVSFTVTGEVDTDYAEYVSGGTRPHPITPKRDGGVLKFTIGGRTIYATRVNHPGTRANDFWTRPLQALPDTIRRIWASLG